MKSPAVIGFTVGATALGGTITVIALPLPSKANSEAVPVVRFNHLIFYEVWRQEGLDEQVEKGTNTYRCMLEGTNISKRCSLSKVTEEGGKSNKWIDYYRFKTIPDETTPIKDFISEDKTIYKAKTSWELIDEWNKHPSKKILIYSDEGSIENSKLLTTVIGKFAVKNNNKLHGTSKYVLGRVREFRTNAFVDKAKTFSTDGKYLKCTLPGVAATYKNCQIYYFDEEDLTSKAFDAKKLKTPFTKVPTVTQGLHYLIKYDEEEVIWNSRYEQTISLDIKIFTDEERTKAPSTGINKIVFEHLSHVVMMGDGEDSVDLALIL